jgi:hypothetical protein
LELVPLRESLVIDLTVRLEIVEQGVDFVFEAVLRRLALGGPSCRRRRG